MWDAVVKGRGKLVASYRASGHNEHIGVIVVRLPKKQYVVWTVNCHNNSTFGGFYTDIEAVAFETFQRRCRIYLPVAA